MLTKFVATSFSAVTAPHACCRSGKCSVANGMKALSTTNHLYLGMWRSQPISAFVGCGCGFHVQNPSYVDADLSCDQNYQLL